MKELIEMKLALKEAKLAFQKGEVPIGAIIFKDEKIIAKAHNENESKNSSFYHAELSAINKAIKKTKNWRLLGTTMVVTMEPCLMCLGAIINSRIEKLVFGAYDLVNGGISLGIHPRKLKVVGGIRDMECSKLLQTFFKKLR